MERLELNVDMNNAVAILLHFIDKRRISPFQVLQEYNHIRDTGTILYDLRTEKLPFNRVVGLQVGETFWFLSAAASKNGVAFEELAFFEYENLDALEKAIFSAKEEMDISDE